MNVGVLSTSVTAGGLGSIKNSSKSTQGLNSFANMLGQVSDFQPKDGSMIPLEGAIEGIMDLLTLFKGDNMKDLLSLSEKQLSELQKFSSINMDAILSVLNVDFSSFMESLSQLHSELMKDMSGMKAENGESGLEEMILQTFQLIQQVPVKDMLKLDLRTVEHTVKLAKIVEFIGNQKDLPIVEARKVTEIQELLKSIGVKLENAMKDIFPTTSKWSELLKQAYNRQMGSTDAGSKLMNETQGILQGNQIHFSLTKTEYFSLVLSGTNQSGSFEKFVNEFTKILGKSQLFSQPNSTKMLIKLYPEQLGSLRIELLQQNGVMTAKILASSAVTKELLDSQLQGLKQAFSSQNLPVEKIEIAQALSESARQERGQNQQQPSRENSNGEQESSSNQQQNDEEEYSFKEMLANMEL